jgi:hypothetical protein
MNETNYDYDECNYDDTPASETELEEYINNLSYTSKSIDLSFYKNRIEKMPDLSRFGFLETFDCSFCDIIELPSLVNLNNLAVLVCNNNCLKCLPDFNDNLEIVYCSNNFIVSISTVKNLKTLDCSYNLLKTLPLLNNIERLDCSHNKIKTIPPLNPLLKEMICSHNESTILSSFGISLTNMDCSWNHLVLLPPLNNRLIKLECSNNKLVSLPVINNSLVILNCSFNQLISLPPLLYVKELDCRYNPMHTLPNLDNLHFINIRKTNIRNIVGVFTSHGMYPISIIFKSKINRWNHFRKFYFLSKLRKRFVSWMWKSREKIIREQFHPRHLDDFLKNNNVSEDDDKSLNMFLDNWIS